MVTCSSAAGDESDCIAMKWIAIAVHILHDLATSLTIIDLSSYCYCKFM